MSTQVAPARIGEPRLAPATADLEHSRYFLSDWMPALLRAAAEARPPTVVADLGAGDGGTLWPLLRAGLVGGTIYAVDISARRVAFCERLSPTVRGIVADAVHVPALPDCSVDAVVSSQVIEHLRDDKPFAAEIARILRPGGWFYVSSVIRGRYAFWTRRGKPPAPRRWQLDATHMREYASESAFSEVLQHSALRLDVVQSSQLKFPLSDVFLRALASAGMIDREALSTFYLRAQFLEQVRGALVVPIPGYRWVEATGRKRPSTT
jgi:SAM-dependent methyltransferase